MKNIQFTKLDDRAHLMQPEEVDDITLESPISAIFTDFKVYKPHVIDADTLASDAVYLMNKAHVHLQLVVDSNKELLGTISQNELNQQSIMAKQEQGHDRELLSVRDVMVSREKLKTLDYRFIDILTIGDMVELLQKEGMQHCLVTEAQTRQIRGIISARDLSRRLHLPVMIESSHSFAELMDAVNDSHSSHQHQKHFVY
jgi:CBS domain containing-hemolysin-like protein